MFKSPRCLLPESCSWHLPNIAQKCSFNLLVLETAPAPDLAPCTLSLAQAVAVASCLLSRGSCPPSNSSTPQLVRS